MNLPGRFIWRASLGPAALAACVLAASLLWLTGAVERFDDERAALEQRSLAERIAKLVDGRLDSAHQDDIRRIASSLGNSAEKGVRITLILANGRALADSEGDPARMDSHADRPEVIAALAEGAGESVRWSSTVARQLRYTAVRVGTRSQPAGVARVAVDVAVRDAVSAPLRSLTVQVILLGAIALAAISFAAAVYRSARISRVTHAARRLSRGDLNTPIDARGHDDIAKLARLLNRLRRRVARQLGETERQRRAVESILAQLGEGVVVATRDGRIVLMNATARTMLGVDDDTLAGVRTPDDWTVERCVPQHELQQLLLPAQDGNAAMPTSPVEVGIAGPQETERRVVLAHVTPFAVAARNGEDGGRADEHDIEDSSEPPPGRLLVLTDVTALTRSVKLKTDFVAHASHELRTPLTAIRGAIETLAQMDLAAGDTSAPRFLDIIRRHSERLEAMAADLLALARLEGGPRRFQSASINPINLREELQDQWRDAANRRSVECAIEISDHCQSLIANRYLLNLVLDNLIENAIKFTEPGGRVAVTLTHSPHEVLIAVSDNGCGIAEKAQSRVFERFYQASQGRAANTAKGTMPRGTGLGLSIVRHAVAAMNGSVRLESELGKGTTVTVRLPQPVSEHADG